MTELETRDHRRREDSRYPPAAPCEQPARHRDTERIRDGTNPETVQSKWNLFVTESEGRSRHKIENQRFTEKD